MHLKTETRSTKHQNEINDFDTANLLLKKRTSTPMSFRDEKCPNQKRILNKMTSKVGFDNTNFTNLTTPYLTSRKKSSTIRNLKDSVDPKTKFPEPIEAWKSPTPVSPYPRPITAKKEPAISIRPISTNLILTKSNKKLNYTPTQEHNKRSISNFNFSHHVLKMKTQETIGLGDLHANPSQSTHSIDSISEVDFDAYCKEKLTENIKKMKEDKTINESPSDRSKSITRQLKPKLSQSMTIDKWIEIHRRRNNSIELKNLSVNVENKNLISDNLNNNKNDKLFKKDVKNENLRSIHVNKSKSRREIDDLMSLDKMQKRLSDEIEEKLKLLRKLESRNEFNSIVTRIKSFLDDVEQFKHYNINDDYKNKFIRLYQYEFTDQSKN